tara:strand:+ start:1906 stop:2211 length:306 start_codon:yes stop_codon:yes gene_type:complete
MNSDKNISKLKVKINVVKRYKKELNHYIKEKESSQEKLDMMQLNNKDLYDIKKQEEILAENHNMVIIIRNRLILAKKDLEDFSNSLDNISNSLMDEVLNLI